jgi:RNA polymerase sigma-70 factor (ECF subfamily)
MTTPAELSSDAELVSGVRAGRRALFSVLIMRHERSTHLLAYSILRDRQLAEDATQEAFVQAYRALPTLRNPSAFGPWVHTIVTRRAVRLRARRRPVAASLEEAGEVPVPSDGRVDHDSERLLSAILRLAEHERQVILLHHFDGHPVETVAHITGRPIGTITKQLSRGYAHLRERLQGVRP